ncbi:MAG: DoxX family protein [Fidelibacterota bacterium]
MKNIIAKISNISPSSLELGLLIIRVGLGVMFILHGYPKLAGGLDTWTRIGEMGVGSAGIHFWHPFWGFLAAISEFGGGIILILGVGFRLGTSFLFLTMIFAVAYHVISGKGSPYHAIESAAVFAGLFLTGPGKYTLSQWMNNQQG